MLFKGTERRTKRQLEEEIENMGGNFHAYSFREYTEFYAKVVDKDVPQALDILSDILQNSKLRNRKIESERCEILRYMKEREGETEEAIFDHLYANAFQYSPLGNTILGPAENVKTITKKDLRNYISTHYTAPRMVIAACGAVKHEEIVEQVKSSFTKLSQDSTTTSELAAKDNTIFTPSEFRIFDDDVPLAHFAVAFNGASWNDPDSITLMVIKEMLGTYSKSSGSAEHTSSTLVETLGISEIAEHMEPFQECHKDTGLFGVYAKAKPDCLDVLAHTIMYELTQLCYKVSEDDVVRACNQLKSLPLPDMDETSETARDIGLEILRYGRIIPYAEMCSRIDAVDASTVKRVANRFIFDKDIAIAAIGPVQGLPYYDWFRRKTYWKK